MAVPWVTLILPVVLVVVGLVPLAITYVVMRRRDPEHALRRTAGLGLLVLGALALTACGACFLGALLEGDRARFEAYSEPTGHGTASYYGIGLGPVALSLWLLLAGAAIGLGVSLYTKRFSLRSLVIALGVLAFMASTPHILIPARSPRGVISARIGRVLTAAEWASLERALSKENLSASVSEPVQKLLPCPVAAALRKVELQPQTMGNVESSGIVGVQLTLRFSDTLDRSQSKALFDALNKHVQNAMPAE